jgi:hypothetical protein
MEDKTVIVSIRVLNISQSLRFYLESVAIMRLECNTQREAWECIELELSKAGLNPRYTSYESFKSGMSQYYKKTKSQ